MVLAQFHRPFPGLNFKTIKRKANSCATVRLALMSSISLWAREIVLDSHQLLAEDILGELIEFEITKQHPDETRAAIEAMAQP
jgi:hypothetical protein